MTQLDGPVDFCDACIEATAPYHTGGTFRLNGIGTTLFGQDHPCPQCGSVVSRLWFCVLFIPIVPLGRFRVLWLSSGRFLSRAVRRVGSPPYPRENADLATLREGLSSPDADIRV